MFDFFRNFLRSKSKNDHARENEPDLPLVGGGAVFSVEKPVLTLRPVSKSEPDVMNQEAASYLEKYRGKISALVQRYSDGQINRKQFQSLYAHYQTKIEKIESALQKQDNQADWKSMVAEGQSILIRRAHSTRLMGYSIYFLPFYHLLKTQGQLPENLSHYLARFRAEPLPSSGKAEEIVQMFALQDERWFCMISGFRTKTLALLSTEPSANELNKLQELQMTFESANKVGLSRNPVDPEILVYPLEFFLGKNL